jgi:hypothetical protein
MASEYLFGIFKRSLEKNVQLQILEWLSAVDTSVIDN